MNKMLEMLQNTVKYFSEAIARIFSPNRDDFPASGVQPFTGDPYNEAHPEA